MLDRTRSTAVRTSRALFAFLVGFLAVSSIWVNAVDPVERDVFFHLAVARDYVSQPLNYQANIKEGLVSEYSADREPVFHLLLASLMALGVPPLVSAAVLSSFVAGTIALVLYYHSGSVLVAICGLFSTNTFLFRLLMCRPHALAVVFVLLGICFLLRRQYRCAALVNFAYTLSYSVPVLLLSASLLEALSSRKIRGLVLVASSSGLGLLAHPHFPDNLTVLWYQGYHVVSNALLGNPAEVAIAGELLPWKLDEFCFDSWLPLGLLIVGACRQTTPKWLLFLQLVLLLLTLRCTRFIEYWAPLVCLSAAPTVSYFLCGANAPLGHAKGFRGALSGRPPRLVTFLVFALFILARPGFGWHAVRTKALAMVPGSPGYRGAAIWLRDNTSAKRVYNAEWYSYPELRYFGTFDLAHGLDPIFVHAFAPRRHRSMQRVAGGEMSLVEFCGEFDYRWIVARSASKLRHWRHRQGVEVRYEDETSMVLEVTSCDGDP